MNLSFQVEQLTTAGASETEVEELLRYNENVFDLAAAGDVELPLPDEPFVACWRSWAEQAREVGAWEVLCRYLPQVHFPIQEGISRSDAYRAATLRGVPPGELPEATGLPLERPESVELELYASLAGGIPVIVVRHRPDFVALVQALAKRNEPVAVPDAQGAAMVAGLANWERIRQLRRSWEARQVPAEGGTGWVREWSRLKPRRELYQDRFMLLSDGPYSGVPAGEMGLEEEPWREISLRIRREHECAHYFTRRLYSSMRNQLLDELMADYAGITGAVGRFHARWFLRFLGLDDGLSYRPGGRLDLYRGEPPLSAGAFQVLHRLIAKAAANLEAFDGQHWPSGERSPRQRGWMLQALASLRLEELAAPQAGRLLAQALAQAGRTLR